MFTINSITINKFSAGRIEGQVQYHTGVPGNQVTVTLSSSQISGQPQITLDTPNNGQTDISFVMTAFGAAHANYAGLPPATDYAVTAAGQGATANQAGLVVSIPQGPNSSQAVVHVKEVAGNPGQLDSESRMDAGEFLRAELRYVTDLAGVAPDANETLGAQSHMGLFGHTSANGGLQDVDNRSIKAVFEEIEDKLAALNLASGSGLAWKDAEDNLSNLAAKAISDSWVQGDAAWVSGPGITDRDRYVLIDGNSGSFDPATHPLGGQDGWIQSDRNAWTGSPLNGKSFVQFSDSVEMLDLVEDHGNALWTIIDGSSNVGAPSSVFSLSESGWDQAGIGGSRTAKTVFQLLIDEDVAQESDIAANDGEIIALQTEMSNLRLVIGGSISNSDTDINFRAADNQAVSGDILYDADGGSGTDVRSALEALETAIESQSSLSFDLNPSYGSPSGSASSESSVTSADNSSAFMQVWINGIMVAQKSGQGGLQFFLEDSLLAGDSLLVLSSKH
jgi:hypothetical protein